MQALFAGLILLLTAADHWTTWACLQSPVAGWEVTEANPVAAWLFDRLGLVQGLLVDSVITLAALAFLVRTRQFPETLKLCVLATVCVATSYAVINNLFAMSSLGILHLPFVSA